MNDFLKGSTWAQPNPIKNPLTKESLEEGILLIQEADELREKIKKEVARLREKEIEYQDHDIWFARHFYGCFEKREPFPALHRLATAF